MAAGEPSLSFRMVAEVRPEYPSDRPVTSEESAELRKLRAEVRELRRAKEILKAGRFISEQLKAALGGSKGLYPPSSYCDEEFAERYNGAEYAKLMPEYDGGARVAGLYQKCVTVE
jgi:hypothetical protein